MPTGYSQSDRDSLRDLIERELSRMDAGHDMTHPDDLPENQAGRGASTRGGNEYDRGNTSDDDGGSKAVRNQKAADASKPTVDEPSAPPVDPMIAINAMIEEARQRAMASGTQAAQSRGLDPALYNALFQQEITRLLGGLPSDRTTWTDSQLRATLGPQFGADTLNAEQSRLRNVYGQQVGAFTPAGFEYSLVPDTFDDAAIDSVYQQQFGDAQQYLERARARGNLTDAGYNAAYGGLLGQGETAKATLGQLGETLLSKYRADIGDIGTQARQGAQGYTLGQSFDPGQYEQRITDRVGEYGDRVSGELRGLAGDNALFDPATLYTAGGIAQGVTSGNRSALAAALERNNNREAPRGLGNRGAF